MKTFVELFQEKTKSCGDHTALVYKKERISYRELDRLSGQIAAKLILNGIGKGDIVPVFLPRGIEYIAAEIGVMKAGAAFSPIITDYPEERVDYICRDCGSRQIIDQDFISEAKKCEPVEELVKVSEQDVVMVVYTSGSTGTPKGIQHSAASFMDSIQRMQEILHPHDDMVFAASAPMSFIVMLFEYYMVLASGGCTHILSDEVRKDVRALEDYYDDNGITDGFISPQMARLFCNKAKSLRTLSVAGERAVNIVGDGYDLFNLYGLTETAAVVCFYKIDRKYENTPIGKPTPGIEIFLLDDNWKEVPDGEEGEICVRGILADGYWNLPEQTERVFRRQQDGTMLFRTGDMGKRLPDGNILYINRRDWMVKINGQRVEAGEIEVSMALVPGVESAVVKAFEDENGQNYLCGFYVSSGQTDETEIRSFLKKRLPGYMIPRFFKKLEAIPKNSNGKTDRKALKAPDLSEYKKGYREPVSEEEIILCRGFEQILHCGKVGIDDDFFSLGGDSINVLKLIAQCSRLPLTPEMVLRGRTPESIGRLCVSKRQEEASAEALETVIPAALEHENQDGCTLNQSQMGIFLECMNAEEAVMYYNIPILLRVKKKMNPEKLCCAIDQAVDNYPLAHVKLWLDEDGNPRQGFKAGFLPKTEIKQMDDKTFANWRQNMLRPFSLLEEPLFRSEVIVTPSDLYIFIEAHHIILDGTTAEILLKNIAAACTGEPMSVESCSVFDMAIKEKRERDGKKYEEEKNWYQDVFGGKDTKVLPYPDRTGKSSVQQQIFYDITGVTNDDIKNACKKYQIMESTWFTGIFGYLLSVYGGTKESMFTTVYHGRTMETMSTMGMFVRTLPVWCDCSDGVSVADYMQKLQIQSDGCRMRARYTFGDAYRQMGIPDEVMFAYQGEVLELKDRAFELFEYEMKPGNGGGEKLVFELYRNEKGYHIQAGYQETSYSKAYVEQLLHSYEHMLRQLLENNDREMPLDELKILDEATEKRLQLFNNTNVEVPFISVTDRIERQALCMPEKIAVIDNHETITYQTLIWQVNRVANAILKTESFCAGNSIQNPIIGVLMDRNISAYVAREAVLKAGGAFLSMDPEYPDERIAFCLNDSGAAIVITTREYLSQKADLWNQLTCNVLTIEELMNETDTKKPDVTIRPDYLCYCIYTSGSTGTPKGVMIEHHSLSNFVDGNEKNHEILGYVEKGSVSLAFAPLTFDVSVMEEYIPLCHGLTVCLAGEREQQDPLKLAEMIQNHHVDIITGTPSYIGNILQIPEVHEAFRQIKVFDLGAEVFPSSLYGKLTEIRPDVFIMNGYGPTETTISCTMKVVSDDKNITIGRPGSNVEVYIVDKKNRILPPGAMGEMVICGEGVGRGYIGLPEKTAESFILLNNQRAYKSGDFARWTMEGEIEFKGRLDNQVKLRGLRVELGEIEEQMSHMEGVRNSVVLVANYGGDDFLAAYYTADHAISSEQMQSYLSGYLTSYMVPEAFMQLEEMPLTANGKADKKALPRIQRIAQDVVPPQNELQQKIFDLLADILGYQDFGVKTPFGFAGLTSIGMMRFMVALSKEFGKALKSQDLKEHDTIEALEEFLKDTGELETYARREQNPLTQTQMGIYVETLQKEGTTVYNIPSLIKLEAGYAPMKLKEALCRTLDAHPYLKGRLANGKDGQVFMKRDDERTIDIPIKYMGMDEFEAEKESMIRPFDLMEDDLCRFTIYQVGKDCYLFEDFHHIAADGASIHIFEEDLQKAYEGNTLEKESYTGYEIAIQEAKDRDSGKYQEAKQWYHSVFGELETDSLIPKDQTGGGNACSIDYALRIKKEACESYCRREKITENIFFLTAFGRVLSKFTNSDDALFATVYDGRNDSRMASCVDMLVKTLPVFIRFEKNQSLADCLGCVKKQLETAMSNDIYPFSEIHQELGINADILFAYQGNTQYSSSLKGEFIPIHARDAGLKAVIQVEIMCDDTEEGKYRLHMEFEDIYQEKTMLSLIESYECILNTMLLEETVELPVLSKKQEEELNRLNRTEVAYPFGKSIVDWFRETAKAVPNHVAVVYKDKKITYEQLDIWTDRIALRLLKEGAGKGKVVSVLIPRCEYMAAASIGVLKTGAAYQPLDSSYPPDRLQFMTEDAASLLLITDEEKSCLLPEFQGKRILLGELEALRDHAETALSGDECQRLLEAAPQNEDLFTLLYTSGSTGVPKGVMIEHKGVEAFCFWYQRYYGLNSESRVIAYASYGFDANMMDMYPALTCGSCLYIIPEEIRLDLIELNRYFETNQITHAFMTTQVGRQFAAAFQESCIKCLSVGGEALVPIDPPAGYKLFNLYGPTEGTIAVTAYPVDSYCENVPIGKPIDNVKLYVMDKVGNRLPVGAMGELCISGRQVSRGYLNREDKTREVFVPNPYEREEGYERMYRTGDVVRLLPDGNVQFVGRKDSQVKIRGFRIELTEVEEIIRRYPGITDATVVAYTEAGGGKYIAAYVVSDEKVDIEQLNSFIMETKPPYMVPAVTMQIDCIPLNQNQKVNKKALPVPEKRAEDMLPPQNKLQQMIYDCVSETLGHKEFGITTDFYQAGLTSITSIRLIILLSEKFQVVLKNKDLKKYATVQLLEEFIQNQRKDEKDLSPTPIPADVCLLPQTQLGIYLECAMDETQTIYNIPILLSLPKEVKLPYLIKAVQNTIDSHPSLNCAIGPNETGDICISPYEAEVSIPVYEKSEEEMEDVKQHLIRPFHFNNPPYYRFEIYKTEAQVYLFMDVHHIIGDGFTVSMLMEDMGLSYVGRTVESEKYTIFDLATEEARNRQEKEYEEAAAYYDSVLKGKQIELLPDGDRNGETETTGNLNFTEDTLSTDQIESFCERKNITPNILFLSALSIVFGKLTNQEEALFTTIYNGRNEVRSLRIAGMLVKTLPVYANVEGNQSVEVFLKQMKEHMEKFMEHDLYSFAEVSRAYQLRADVMFAYQGEKCTELNFAGYTAKLMELESSATKAPLSLDVYAVQGRYELAVEYRSDRYSSAYIENLCEIYFKTVSQLLEVQKLEDIVFLTEKAKAKLNQWNDTFYPMNFKPVNQLFEEQAALHPEKIAVIANGEKMTYEELNRAANRAAHGLLRLGVQKGQMIGVLLERKKEAYIARQGVIKAGAAFLPLDPEYPADRIHYCLKDSAAPVLITSKTYMEEHPDLDCSQCCQIIAIEHLLETEEDVNPDIMIEPGDLCYCIYTSGSTGKPKGVMIEHHNLANFVNENPKNHEILGYTKKASVSLAFAALTFDVSIMEEFIPLCNGMTICMANEEERHNPLMLSALILENNVDMISCTPSFISNIIDMPQMRDAIKNLASYDFGAEAFPGSLYGKITAIRPDAYIMNGYGPTEATVSCTMKVMDGKGKVTIGRPNANVQVYMVDCKNRILPPGIVGEMVICGEGVGRGYVGLPEKTAEVFIELEGKRAYKSGDLALWTLDGEIEFHGRKDNQVKLRGLRIELGEIEEAMNQVPSVNASIVIVRNNGTEDFLAGYFTADTRIDIDEMTRCLKHSLAAYMVPGALVQLETMPLTSNGKIDKKQLPDVEYAAAKHSYTAPETDTEREFCEQFEMALKIRQVGATDNFFEIGGTSLSASKIAMYAMTKNYPIVYADIFKYPTPRQLAALVKEAEKENVQTREDESGRTENAGLRECEYDEDKKAFKEMRFEKVLSHNILANVNEVRAEFQADNILLTGATGFLGIHMLKAFLDYGKGNIYCLIRKGRLKTVESRLSVLLMYYFDNPYTELFNKRIFCIEGDITDKTELLSMNTDAFDMVVNCAACVKHFVHDDILQKINVEGVQNLIELCKENGKRLIHISTVSIAGEGEHGMPPQEKRIHEDELWFGQKLNNPYILSKFQSEEAVLSAIENGLDAKIMRVGNLMSRSSDGEFQINYLTNGFMRTLRGYVKLGQFPVGMMSLPVEFSPIDSTALAIFYLSQTQSQYSIFHPYNNHAINMADVIYAMKKHGFKIDIVSDEDFQKALEKAVESEYSEELSGLIAYVATDDNLYAIESDNRYTTEILYRLNYKWPITDDQYLLKAIETLDGMGFFEGLQPV